MILMLGKTARRSPFLMQNLHIEGFIYKKKLCFIILE